MADGGRLWAVGVLCFAAGLPGQAVAAPAPAQCAMGRDYWVVRPPRFDPQRTYWLAVLVHGFRGRGADALWMRRALVEFDDCLIVAPTFPDGYQLLHHATDRQLLGLAARLGRTYRLHPQMFLAGFSGGAQFGHRFTMQHPERVAGCAAHSGGSWGPAANPAARHIPLAFSCGLDDVAKSSLAQQHTRVQGAHRYFRQLAREGFFLKARLFRRLGHATSPATEQMITDCYRLATRGVFPSRPVPPRELTAATLDAWLTLPGKPAPRATLARHARQARRIRDELAGLGGQSADGEFYWVDDAAENIDGWRDNPAARRHRAHLVRQFAAR